MCTEAGGRLETGALTEIQGPAALSVADAEVQEGPGAALAFSVPEGIRKGVPIGASALTPADGAAPSAASPGEEAPDRGRDLRARGFGLGGCPAS